MTEETNGSPETDPERTEKVRGIGQNQLITIFFFGVLLFILYQLYRVFSPFLPAIAWGTILVIIFYPVHTWIVRRVAGRLALASVCTTVIVILTVILPGVILVNALASQVLEIYHSVSFSEGGGLASLAAKFRETPFGAIWERLKATAASYEIDVPSILAATTKSLSAFLAEELRLALKNAILLALSFVMMVLTLFFFFRDGEKLYRTIHRLIPMEESHKDAVFSKLYATISAVVRGLTVTAMIQGILAGLAYWALGVPYPAFLGFLTALMALIPFPGAASVWIPASLYLVFVSDALVPGILLALWGFFVVSTIDNFLKPVLIGSQTNLPTLFLLFSILGGLQAYGFLGIFLGPVLLAILLAFLDIYQEVYHRRV